MKEWNLVNSEILKVIWLIILGSSFISVLALTSSLASQASRNARTRERESSLLTKALGVASDPDVFLKSKFYSASTL